MSLLKRIPIHYRGELHDVRLINFSVEMREILTSIPRGIKLRNFDGRAMISMVDVKLKNMCPALLPFVRFNYRHVAFRVLVDDSEYNDGASKGIYFLRSFTDNATMVAGGALMTDYNLERAQIVETGDAVVITQGTNRIRYTLPDQRVTPDPELKETVGALDRAYSMLGDSVRVTQIQREKWPIQQVACTGFENSFFQTARLEGAFRVNETIYYDWLPPKTLAV